MFTGKMPEGIASVECMCLRYGIRAQVHRVPRGRVPTFTFATTGADPGDFPA